MAFTASGIYVHTIQEALRATAITGTGGLDLRLATFKIALHSNSLTQGTAPINYSATDTTWANTNEVSGTGWAAGGVVLNVAAPGATSVVPTLAEGTAGSLRYDHTNDIAVSGTTLTNARGCIIYADNITAPTDLDDAMIVAVTFGADYSTVAGIFGIQWSATGIFEIDLTP
jgi:hypothetical protein